MQEMQEMRVQSLGWEDRLEWETATHSSIPAWRVPWVEGSLVGYSPWGHKESDVTEHSKVDENDEILDLNFAIKLRRDFGDLGTVKCVLYV